MKRLIANLLVLVLAVCAVCGNHTKSTKADEHNNNVQTISDNLVSHGIAPGESSSANPLRGFIPYNFSTTSFPHSMEWFYIPVSAVQKGMNDFDWSALERELNAVAGRGHQAVFRFYYDYPGEGGGVPQFVLDHGLQMKYYNEPDALGGDGYCPDYEDAYFRQSMKSFIEAFGRQYDGDGRIGFITIGLLGFWGEWHNWPYDEDTSDGKADWSISTAVYKEVIDAFDASFNKTKVCVREPKWGIDFSKYDVGYHDDSFGYATLSMSNGGQDWSFLQKLKDAKVYNAWQSNCIGGEIYPPSQFDIFSGRSADGSFQDWNKCLEESHATWMLCENMKHYSGDTRNRALTAAKSLGYDLRATTAYYPDVVRGQSLQLKVDMKNIGVAPFYYDHNMWPVEIGFKKDGQVVKTYSTDWDLCDVSADGANHSFEKNIEGHGLADGNYQICIRVVNPIAGGNTFTFANEGQGSDGWLNLGNVNINLSTIDETTKENETSHEVIGTDDYSIYQDKDNVYFKINPKFDFANWQIYLDSDGDVNTGFLVEGETGYEYLIENGDAYKHIGNSAAWSYESTNDITVLYSNIDRCIYVTMPKNNSNINWSRIKTSILIKDDQWSDKEKYGPVEVPMVDSIISGDIMINGIQINSKVPGLRTVYSFANTIEGQSVVEKGLVYGIDDNTFSEEEMVVGSKNSSVHSYSATIIGKLDLNVGKDNTYAMTMRFVGENPEEYSAKFYVRAYAKLANGRYVYTEIKNYKIFDVADHLYTNNLSIDRDMHEYLYDYILYAVDNNYRKKEYISK